MIRQIDRVMLASTEGELMADKPTVCIIDKDAAVCDSLSHLLATLDVAVEIYACAEDFLRESLASTRCCVITELYLPGINGIELLEELRARGIAIPTIVLASNSDVPTAVRAMRAGAIDFIDKPFVDRVLLNRIRHILAHRY